MYQFAYHRPETLDAAREIFAGADDPKFLAGGMTLIPTMKQRLAAPSDLVDLGRVADLRGIRVAEGSVRIGATTPHAEVAASAEVRRAIPALAALAAGIGDPQVRNRGTLGGSIANADPAADYPAAIVGLGATIETDRRTIAGDDFFTGMFETALEADEVIVAVRFPVADKAGYAKFPNPASRYAVAGVMVVRTGDGVRVAVTGAGPCVFRVAEMEAALAERFAAEVIRDMTVPADDLNGDIHASPEYRAHLVGVMARRAVEAALSGA